MVGLGLVGTAAAKIYLKEKFDAGWEKRWDTSSTWKPEAERGAWKHVDDGGIQTSQDARFYAGVVPLSEPFDNKGKDLIVSYTVKHTQDLDCGGSYLKLLPKGFDGKTFGGDAPYSVMFGPDQCGYSTRKTHVILHSAAKKENLQTKKSVKCETDKKSHRYTLIVKPDNTYEVQIDGTKTESGALGDDFDFLEPKKIKDPSASKPADWVDAPQMPDPEDVKPAGWDDVPAKLPDAKASKPDDWDDDEDGEWEAPLIDNPAHKGEWKQKQIPNPAYKGAWVHPEIDNPAFKEDPNMYNICAPCAGLGFELWQVKSGTIFDDIIVTDSLKEAEAFAKETFEVVQAAEKKAEEEEKAKKEAEDKKKAEEAAAEAAKKAEEKKDDDDDDDDDDDKDEL
jgi:calreticulin